MILLKFGLPGSGYSSMWASEPGVSDDSDVPDGLGEGGGGWGDGDVDGDGIDSG
jgi:hypothetical protein